MDQQPPPKQRRGFATMNPEKRREIAAKGGASVPADKRSFSQNVVLAAVAGRKGGKVTKASSRTHKPYSHNSRPENQMVMAVAYDEVRDTVERAYALACSGEFATVSELIVRLKADGHETVMTDLRSRTLRRELRQICQRSSEIVQSALAERS